MTVAAVVLGAAIGAVLGALGGGGAILTVPVLVYLLGESAQAATAGSLVVVGTTAALGALGHSRRGDVRWRTGVAFAAAGVVAAWAGAQANRFVDPDLLMLLFAGLVLVAATGMLTRRAGACGRPPGVDAAVDRPRLADVPRDGGTTMLAPPRPVPTAVVTEPSAATRVGKVVAAGLLVGALTGFFGVGGGFVVVPALVLVLRLPMTAAVGTSLVVVALNSAVALAARGGHAPVDWTVVLPLTVAAVLGTVLGQRLARRVSMCALSRAFAALLVGVATFTGLHSAVALL